MLSNKYTVKIRLGVEAYGAEDNYATSLTNADW